jgi:tRNA (Thr-GGU) A37 N-methylase
VRKRDGRTTIELYDAYRPVLLGVLATRAPMRPNLIALSRCRVLGVDGNVIEIDGIDAYADTPVLDIKP